MPSMFAKSLKEILEILAIKSVLLKKGNVISRLDSCWSEIIGAELSKQCTPERLQHGTLWVSATHPGWAQQIHFYQKPLVDKINGYFHQNIVKTIRCGGVGTEGSPKHREAGVRANHAVKERTSALQDVHPIELEDALADIDVPDLRDTFARVWKKARGFMQDSTARLMVCSVCGKQYRGTHKKMCQACEEKDRNAKRGKIERLLQEAPWANFSTAGEALDHVGEEYFHAVKSEMLRSATDILRRESFRYLDHQSAKGAVALKKLIVNYVSLRSGLTPDKIHAKIIEQTIGQRRFRLLRMKGVVF